MKKKTIIFSIICIFILTAFSGCTKQNAITNSKFEEKAKEKGFTVGDATAQYESYDYIKTATVAQSPDGWQVEFYVLDEDANAVSMFNTNKQIFETYKGNASVEKSKSVSNYSMYSLVSSGYYMHLYRIDNTLMYVKVDEEYKDAAREFVGSLGY